MTKKKAKRTPGWYRKSVESALDRQERLAGIILLSRKGIGAATGMPRLIEVLEKSKDNPDTARLEAAKSDAALAQVEIDSEFSTLMSFGVMALWSWFESFMLDFAALWITRKPTTLNNGIQAKVRLDMVELANLPAKDRSRFIIESLDNEIGGAKREGFRRFQNLYDRLGFKLTLNDEQKRAFTEFQAARNCFAHRFGIVDQKLVRRCPWLKIQPGTELRITHDDFARYGNATSGAILELIHEANAKFGIDSRTSDEKREAAKDKS